MRTIRIGIKEIQVPNNSSNKKWNNDIKVYLNLEKSETGITVTRVKSARKKNFKILSSSAIRIMKKNLKFKKRMIAPKTPALISIYSELSKKIY
jgi:hypothetical protein